MDNETFEKAMAILDRLRQVINEAAETIEAKQGGQLSRVGRADASQSIASALDDPISSSRLVTLAKCETLGL